MLSISIFSLWLLGLEFIFILLDFEELVFVFVQLCPASKSLIGALMTLGKVGTGLN